MANPSSENSLVLVLGAGASREAGLPVGDELKQRIADTLDIRYDDINRQSSGDRLINQAFSILAEEGGSRSFEPYIKTARRIRDAMPLAISIDHYIDSHRSDPMIAECGKLVIARCILEAERTSALWFENSNIFSTMDFSSLETTWYNAFFRLLTENCQQADLPERFTKVAIVCFNYDRCVEQYLHSALQCYYGMTSHDACEILSKLEIYHPYGMTGKLPWQDSQEGFEFGGRPGVKDLRTRANELRTFTEGVDAGKSDIAAIRATMSNAARIAFWDSRFIG